MPGGQKMKKINLIPIILFGLFSNSFALDKNSCKKIMDLSDKKICRYDANTASDYAKKYFDKKEKSPFGYYPNNCTHFVSQALLSGLVGSSDTYTVDNEKYAFDADRYDNYSWFFDTKDSKGTTWAEANGLYVYARESAKKKFSNYQGLMFKGVTRDYISSYETNTKKRRQNGGALDVDKIKIGDVIFMDYSYKNGLNYKDTGKKANKIVTDGEMEHSVIVTDIQSWRKGYNQIRVTYNSDGNTKAKDESLHDVNKRNGFKIEFHVYRPLYFIEKKW
jgi:hypothetical protein